MSNESDKKTGKDLGSLLRHGAPHSSVVWARLSPEEKKQKLKERAMRKMEKDYKKKMRESFDELLAAKREEILSTIMNCSVEQMKKALTGDTQAYCAVFDRVVGKIETQVDVTSNGATMTAPTIVFTSDELPDWKDEK